MEITTIGLDLAKNVFQVHAIKAPAKLLCGRRCGVRRCCRFSEAAALPGRHRGVRDATTGRARLPGLATRCG